MLCGVGVGLISVVPWLALFAFPYWYLARHALPYVDGPLRFELTRRLGTMGAVTGLWCLLAPLVVGMYAPAVAIPAAAVSIVPAVRAVMACLRAPSEFTIALMNVGTWARRTSAAGACVALVATALAGPVVGGLAELASAVACAYVVSSRVGIASHLAKRVWIPTDRCSGQRPAKG
ncbi:hypothetical protein [Methanopyrus kandleri]|uniref:Uncharacterized domain specific for M.kandleri, MK-12 family n=1 Tax=Methanopyrus kandleri (strain AV19 / DSM 6324 / JCM 9639 / NBRC 100938) TaxID=190192 RepID=Q8TVR1_METKA|nr:hypothetical protein [Methanopyrus kandleri]AAM02540.1 Uncharacterized domain specific for M.kandleri, MK-12 family [Methanopyrus kandleri AV19]